MAALLRLVFDLNCRSVFCHFALTHHVRIPLITNGTAAKADSKQKRVFFFFFYSELQRVNYEYHDQFVLFCQYLNVEACGFVNLGQQSPSERPVYQLFRSLQQQKYEDPASVGAWRNLEMHGDILN